MWKYKKFLSTRKAHYSRDSLFHTTVAGESCHDFAVEFLNNKGIEEFMFVPSHSEHELTIFYREVAPLG